MQALEFGLVKDKLWFYYAEGTEEPEQVTVTSVVHKTVTLSNGHKIPAARFYELCEPALDDSPMESEEHSQNRELIDSLGMELDLEQEGEGGQVNKGYDPVKEMMGGIQFDANGIPIVKDAKQQPQKQIISQQPKSLSEIPRKLVNAHDSPLIALVEKGQFKTVELMIKLQVPTVNKTIFNALIETYPDEEINLLLDHLINKIGVENIKDAVKTKMQQYYKTTKKDVTA